MEGRRQGRRVVVMGVCGSGKTAVGRALGRALAGRWGAGPGPGTGAGGGRGGAWAFRDGDVWHSAASKKKMAAGVALEDSDRAEWLQALGGVLRGWTAASEDGGLVLACSALKRSYREALREHASPASLHFVCLMPPEEELLRRIEERSHEFMPATLLDSQLETLELPAASGSDAAILVAGAEALQPPEAIADAVARKLQGLW